MNVPYVAHSYRVPPPVLYQALGIPHPRVTATAEKDCARAERAVEQIIETLQRAMSNSERTTSARTGCSMTRGRSP